MLDVYDGDEDFMTHYVRYLLTPNFPYHMLMIVC